MRKLRFSITLITIALMFIVSYSQPLFSQPPNREQPDRQIDAQTRSQVIEKIIVSLDEYIFPEVARRMQDALRTQLQAEADNEITSAAEFAETLSNRLQAISNDKHLQVFYSFKPFPAMESGRSPSPKKQEKQRRSMAWDNFGFYKVERLPGNIGYLDFRVFLPPDVAGATAIAAMNFLSNTSALIFDIRKNNGGCPDMVALISSYLFDDKPVHLNDLIWRERDESGEFRERIEQHWTLPYVPGARYLDKPVYVLTSNFTFSGAEEFANNLKQLKRATIVGETTGGGANPGRFEALHDHFGIFIPTGRAVNPITQTNWEGTGVEPDLKVSAERAVQTAYLAALKELLAQTTEPEFVEELKQVIATVEQESAESNRN